MIIVDRKDMRRVVDQAADKALNRMAHEMLMVKLVGDTTLRKYQKERQNRFIKLQQELNRLALELETNYEVERLTLLSTPFQVIRRNIFKRSQVYVAAELRGVIHRRLLDLDKLNTEETMEEIISFMKQVIEDLSEN